MTLTEKSGHLAWCALVALALARQNGDVLSPAQENLFLTRWLATALKQRRFSREVTPDIEWLLNDLEWSGRNAVALSAGVNGIYLSRANLNAAFDDNGRQINPLMARLTGSIAGMMKVFDLCGGRQSLKGMSPCPTSIR
ncbi:DUF2913 family protein [Salmonella enterica subsp. enterica serovar Enteritidis]|nr:DUF2913 family protein [Salmonella enterica subsp. enterica serovar Enteritidis]